MRFLPLFLLLIADTAAGAAENEPALDQAKAHFRAGEALYQLGNYVDALREFKAGYAIASRPLFLLNLGQVYRKLNETEAAITAFQDYLGSAPEDDPRRPEVEALLAKLRAELAEHPAQKPPPASVVVTAPAPAPRPPTRRPWYRDPLGGSLVGVGLGGIAVGAGLFADANAIIGQSQVDLSHYTMTRGASGERVAGLAVLGVGGALVLSGVIRYAVHHRGR